MNYALVRPDNKKKNYQELVSRYTSIEPPLWLLMRAEQLKKDGHNVIILDQELNGKIEPLNIDFIEFFPFGVHPSGFIQARSGVKEQMYEMGQNSYVKCWNSLPDFDINLIPDWGSLPLNKYRCHNWQAWGRESKSPHGILFTSISCPFKCSYCVIKEYYGQTRRLRDVDVVIKDLSIQIANGIRNIKIIDELFLYEKERVNEICDRIIELKVPDLNMWCFVRIDTCTPDILKKMKKAGILWVGLGIESGNQEIRRKELKANFSNDHIVEVTKMVKDCGVNICPNYMFGFENDSLDTMQETLDLALRVQGECSNFNCLMAYKGTPAYQNAVARGWEVPDKWEAYAQQSYDVQPLRTNFLTPEEVLRFRDKAFMAYYTNPQYLSKMLGKFGEDCLEDIRIMTSIKLKRKLLGD
jgi:radical SAM superfamily enzyme YgiQ (UPF0313 family)